MKKVLSHLAHCAVSGMMAGAALSGCAAQPDKIAPAEISPERYKGLNCRRLVAERDALVPKLAALTDSQKAKADQDTAAFGIGMLVFLPALFTLGGEKDLGDELALAKGEFVTLSTAGTAKGCF